MSGLADWRKDMTDGTDGNTEAANEDEVRFSPEEQKVIDEFKEKIDITDTDRFSAMERMHSRKSRLFPKWLSQKCGQRIWERWAR